MRSPHRWASDRRIFAGAVRRPGGSVRIDASGSMSLMPADLLKIVTAAAGALVACYNGKSEGWGAIRALARDGLRVPDRLVRAPLESAGNVIDGPALRWLAARPTPLIWVSRRKRATSPSSRSRRVGARRDRRRTPRAI